MEAAPPTCAAPSTSGTSRRGEEGLGGGEQRLYCRECEGKEIGLRPALACARLPAMPLVLLTPLLQSICHPVCSMDWSGTSTATNKAMDSRHRCGQCWGVASLSRSQPVQPCIASMLPCSHYKCTAGSLGGLVP